MLPEIKNFMLLVLFEMSSTHIKNTLRRCILETNKW